MSVLLAGCDFSSSPSSRKPIVFATGSVEGGRVQLSGLQAVQTLQAYSHWLEVDRPWVCGFDFPFGLPRELIETLGWPLEWLACMRHYAHLSRPQIRQAFAGFCQARPAGRKFAHRATDPGAGSSPSMKWVNPPVAYMLHAGVPPLIDAGVQVPGLLGAQQAREAAPHLAHLASRVALEAYPGLLAFELIGRRSYKNSPDADRLIARKDLVDALEQGRTRLGVRLKMGHALREALVDDDTGDRLDAAMCLVQAAWASAQPGYGLPPSVDPLEGWIVTA